MCDVRWDADESIHHANVKLSDQMAFEHAVQCTSHTHTHTQAYIFMIE